MKEAVARHLCDHGWAPGRYAMVANRFYPTAVGVKEAQAYLKDFGPDPESFILDGTYYSEGRNALSVGVMIPKNADDETLRQLVARFAANADESIAQTYAAKLLRSRH